MPKYTVPIVGPDGTAGTITVNASDANAAVENAAQGGNTATGAATLSTAADPNSADSGGGSGSGSGSSTYNTKSDTQTAGGEGSIYGYTGSGTGDAVSDSTKSKYEARFGETPQKWMERVFQQGTRDFGGNLDPSVANPYGRTPYAQWFQNRYQDVAAPNLMLQALLSNNLPTGGDSLAPFVEGGMKDFMNGGAGRGYGTNAGTDANLGNLNALMQQYQNKDPNLSEGQQAMAMDLMDHPDKMLGLINAQFAGGLGANPYTSGALQTMGQGLLDEYYDDPVGHKDQSFLNNFLKQIHAQHY